MMLLRAPTMATALVLLSVIAVWTPLSMAQPANCPFVRAQAVGNENALNTTLASCLECLGRTCDFVYFSERLIGPPCRQILNGTSALVTQYAYRQCDPALLACNSLACGGTCSPCLESRNVSLTETCFVNGGFRTCRQQRCLADLVRIRVAAPAQAAMTGQCEAFCNLQTGCEAYVQTNTSCVTLANVATTGVSDLVFANSSGCVMENVTDFCFINPCQNGGLCFNRTDNFECFCPQGFSGPTCSVVACPGVVTTTGVTAMVSSNVVGSNVTFMCLDNFLPISGDALQTCLPNLTWSGSPLMCAPVVTYRVSLRVVGRVYSIITLTLFGDQGSSPATNIRLVSWGFFASGVNVPIRSTDLGTLRRALVEVITGFNFPRPRLTLTMRVTAPNGDVFAFNTTTLAGGDVRDLPAIRV